MAALHDMTAMLSAHVCLSLHQEIRLGTPLSLHTIWPIWMQSVRDSVCLYVCVSACAPCMCLCIRWVTWSTW